MPKPVCPFHQRCPFRDACRDHSWLCIWGIWLALLLGVGFVALLFWSGGLI